MFRKMIREKQLMDADAVTAVLERATSGVLACLGDEDYPYAVPLNYVYWGDKIYFHSAKAGHKIDAIKKHPKVSFAVTGEDTIAGAEYTSYFRSVIAFGKAAVVEDNDERLAALRALVEKYSGDQPEESNQAALGRCTQACLVAIDVEHITGKQALEYVKA